jgi:hypothetical protein
MSTKRREKKGGGISIFTQQSNGGNHHSPLGINVAFMADQISFSITIKTKTPPH